jgi:hypothetical protein
MHGGGELHRQRRNPQDPQRNSNLGTALMRKGNGPAAYPADFLIPYEEAMKYFHIALEQDPTSAAAMEGMGVRACMLLPGCVSGCESV